MKRITKIKRTAQNGDEVTMAFNCNVCQGPRFVWVIPEVTARDTRTGVVKEKYIQCKKCGKVYL